MRQSTPREGELEIELIRWACEGFRCPDMAIDLSSEGRLPRVSLIQMPNGTGKTTTLALLKATLTGEAKNWSPEHIREMQHATDRRDDGRFTVELRVDGKPLKLELIVDFDSGSVSYATTSPDMGGYNKEWAPPPNVRRFLSRRFVDLFVFDGELANALLDSKETRAEEAIETLCQLDLLEAVSRDCEIYWDRATAKLGSRNERGLSRYQSIATKLSERIAFLKRSAETSAAKLHDVREDISKLDAHIKRLIEEDGKNRERFHEMEKAKGEKEQLLASALRELVDRMRRPEALATAFGAALASVKANLDRVKLPDSTSRQFFQELALEVECICGRPIGEHERQEILTRSEEFLGEDLAGVLNSFKHDVDLLSPTEQRKTLEGKLSEIQTIRNELALLEADMAQIEKNSLTAAGENPEIYRRKLEEARLEEANLAAALDVLRGPATSADSTLITGAAEAAAIVVIAAAERQYKLASDEINRINGTLDLRTRLDILKKVCSDAREIARQRLKLTIVDRCNARLEQVLKGDPLRIARIDRSLVLQDRDSGSTGQNLAVGYTFLAEALHKGAHDFPLIVDSPAGPLDHAVRREIATMVPHLCKQFVAFTISTEREAFLEPLESSALDDVKYVTVFRKTRGNAELMRDLPAGHVDNGSSVVVTGRDYFVRFALSDEEGVS
jgi:DNA sulfur modification protein DndD